MAVVLRRHHYEVAFEEYLRTRRIPYLAVDEARKALLPASEMPDGLKSFDLVVCTGRGNLLVDIKGRQITARSGNPLATGRMENWVMRQDLEALRTWERLLGDGFEGAFVFLYWCHVQPPDGLWQEIFTHRDRWYAPRVILRRDYARHQVSRSPRWGTVQLPRGEFDRLSEPFRP